MREHANLAILESGQEFREVEESGARRRRRRRGLEIFDRLDI
jgi:hypothetical protein